jgi:hypothetical protein
MASEEPRGGRALKTRIFITIAVVAALAGIGMAQSFERYADRSAQDISIVSVGGAVGYDPDVGTVQDGVVHDIRPTVSADRRYVQLDVGSAMAVIIRIDSFQVVTD